MPVALRKYLVNIVIALVVFAIYIEITPGMGKIWIRPNAKLQNTISLKFLLDYCLEVFKNKYLWLQPFLDLNSVFFIGVVSYFLSIYQSF